MGRYHLISPVCVDALGETWTGHVAEGPERGRKVLVTVCNQPATPRAVERLVQCCERVQAIRHPNVLAFLDGGERGDEFILVSEYLDGEPLSTLLAASARASSPIPQGVALAIMKGAVDTLAALRTSYPEISASGGLCPESIFVASFGEAMIRNPGLVERAMAETVFRHHPAALPYRAPEQLRDPRNVAETADVFSAGVILWEMLSGRSLFGVDGLARLGASEKLTPENLREVAKRIRSMDVPSLAALPRPEGALHPDVIRLVEGALHREPLLRHRTLEQLGEALSALPEGVVANAFEVSGVVKRLVGKAIHERLERLTRGAPFSVHGSSSPSERLTIGPDRESGRESTIVRQRGQGAQSSGAPPSSEDTFPSEPPSARMTLVMHPEDNPFDAPTRTGQHPRLGDGRASASVGARKASAASGVQKIALPAEETTGGVSKVPSPPPPPEKAPAPELSVDVSVFEAAESVSPPLAAGSSDVDTPSSLLQLPAVDISPDEMGSRKGKRSSGWILAVVCLVAAGGVGAFVLRGGLVGESATTTLATHDAVETIEPSGEEANEPETDGAEGSEDLAELDMPDPRGESDAAGSHDSSDAESAAVDPVDSPATTESTATESESVNSDPAIVEATKVTTPSRRLAAPRTSDPVKKSEKKRQTGAFRPSGI